MYVSWEDPRFAEARELTARAGVLDLHVDSIIQQRLFGYNVRRKHRAKLQGQPLWWHADIPRMHEAGYGGACMGIHYWPVEREGGWLECNKQIDYLDLIADNDPNALRIREPGDWRKALDANQVGIMPGVEGAHMLNGKIERVQELAKRDVAYLTLAHFSKNAAATPSLGRGADEVSGLTDFGKDVVRELNRNGLIVDLAHVNTPGVLDACAITTAPPLCTHTGVKGVHDSPRNITDEEIDAIAELDGAIGIIFGPGFLTGRLRAGTECVLDHIDYVVQRVGVSHVCIGSDYDGWMPSIPRDHKDCRDIVKVTFGLLQRGYTVDDVVKILSGNVHRVHQAVWAASERA